MKAWLESFIEGTFVSIFVLVVLGFSGVVGYALDEVVDINANIPAVVFIVVPLIVGIIHALHNRR